MQDDGEFELQLRPRKRRRLTSRKTLSNSHLRELLPSRRESEKNIGNLGAQRSDTNIIWRHTRFTKGIYNSIKFAPNKKVNNFNLY